MKYLSLLPFLLLVVAAATTGALFMPGAWYAGLAKPSWTPPDWLFGPAWTVLYFMIAVAGWRVWQAEGLGPALVIWLVGLAFNAAWSYLMFGIHRIDLALFDAFAMLASIIAFILAAWRVDATAALLFVPYLAWVSFATVLNYTIQQMNPT
ncbi:MAG: TspO/MBR family protein [Hyphomicrobium sp.]